MTQTSQASPARKAAFNILMTIERGRGHCDELLRGTNVSVLSPADRNLTTTLVLGVLRWQIQLDKRLRPLLKRPNGKLDAEVLLALRLGAFQLLHLDRVPARAVIDESVELTKEAGHKFASGMVNAVLRKLSASAAAKFGEDSDPRAAYPAWMVERWTRAFGEAATCSLCSHGQSQPQLTVRIDDPQIEEELAQQGIVLAPCTLLTAARMVVSGDVTATPAFREGRVRIQDEGSQLVAEIAGSGSRILDCCAAPGGKTLILAERNPGAHIVACEASPQRLAMLRKRAALLGPRIECRLADAAALTDANAYDLVLADVPCSGTGTLGRNPEIRHRLAVDEFAVQAARQNAILTAALRAARPGACVVYSTCSLEAEENEQVVDAVLRQDANVRAMPLQTRIGEMLQAGVLTEIGAQKLRGCVTPEGYLRLFPGALGSDGFFVAALCKSGETK